MAHKRKDTLTTPKEWAKHLRPFGKRQTNKAERRAAKTVIRDRYSPFSDTPEYHESFA